MVIPKPSSRTLILLTAVVVAIAVAGGLTYFLTRRGGVSKEHQTTSQNPSGQADNRPVVATEVKQYESPAFMLSFDYPENWKVTEAEDGSRIVVTSPAMPLPSGSGQTVQGQTVLTIRRKGQPLPEFDKGNAAATRESEKLTYTKPSSVQRGSTYASFLRYAGNYDSGNLDGIYVTGDVGYVVDQAIPAADFVPVDPIVSVTFMQCANAACSGQGTPISVAVTLWDEPAFADPVRTMLQSLTVN